MATLHLSTHSDDHPLRHNYQVDSIPLAALQTLNYFSLSAKLLDQQASNLASSQFWGHYFYDCGVLHRYHLLEERY